MKPYRLILSSLAIVAALIPASDGVFVSAVRAEPMAASYWRSEDNAIIVKFELCAENYCGKIVAILDDRISETDQDALCGLRILGALTLRDDGTYSGGWLLDPESGAVFNVTVRIDNQSMTLRVFEHVSSWGEDILWKQTQGSFVTCQTTSSHKS